MSEYTSDYKGSVFLDRRITETEWFTGCSPSTVYVMFYLLLSANYETKMWKGIKVKRGEVITSTGNSKTPGRLMEETRLPYSTLARSLKKLEELGEISVSSKTGSHGYTLISITHYDLYITDKKVNKKVDKKTDSKAENNKEVVEETEEEFEEYDWSKDD